MLWLLRLLWLRWRRPHEYHVMSDPAIDAPATVSGMLARHWEQHHGRDGASAGGFGWEDALLLPGSASTKRPKDSSESHTAASGGTLSTHRRHGLVLGLGGLSRDQLQLVGLPPRTSGRVVG